MIRIHNVLEYKRVILFALLFVGMFFVCGCNFDEKYSAEIYPANGTEFDSIDDFYCYVVVKEHKKARFLLIPAFDETKERKEKVFYHIDSTHPISVVGGRLISDISGSIQHEATSGESNKLCLTTDTPIKNDKRVHIHLICGLLSIPGVPSIKVDYYIKKQSS